MRISKEIEGGLETTPHENAIIGMASMIHANLETAERSE